MEAQGSIDLLPFVREANLLTGDPQGLRESVPPLAHSTELSVKLQPVTNMQLSLWAHSCHSWESGIRRNRT